MNKLLQNAVISIKLGIDDYFMPEPERAISSIRNIYAGIILLYKSKLLSLSSANSDEVLIKARIKPILEDNKVVFIGDGKNTIDITEIRKRFSSLNIDTNWIKLEGIQKERNNIEHYYSTVSHVAIRSIIVDALFIIKQFIVEELEDDPALLMGEAWKKMLGIKDIYDKERKECNIKIAECLKYNKLQVNLILKMRCPICGSDLLYPSETFSSIDETILRCSNCSTDTNAGNLIEDVIEKEYGIDDYMRVKEGGEANIRQCPECGKMTYINDDDLCLYCLYEKEYEECLRCGCELSVDEQDLGGLCFYCDNELTKIMKED